MLLTLASGPFLQPRSTHFENRQHSLRYQVGVPVIVCEFLPRVVQVSHDEQAPARGSGYVCQSLRLNDRTRDHGGASQTLGGSTTASYDTHKPLLPADFDICLPLERRRVLPLSLVALANLQTQTLV